MHVKFVLPYGTNYFLSFRRWPLLLVTANYMGSVKEREKREKREEKNVGQPPKEERGDGRKKRTGKTKKTINGSRFFLLLLFAFVVRLSKKSNASEYEGISNEQGNP